MARKELILVLGMIAAASPASATNLEPSRATAPAGGPETRYCMRVEPPTGSLIEKVRCWTREEWEAKGVDLDKDWAREGVRVIDGAIDRPVRG